MLTLPSSWQEAAKRAGSRPRVLLSIYDGVNTWKCLSGSCDLFEYPTAIMSTGTVSTEFDPLTRAIKTTEHIVEVADAWIRPLIVDNRLEGKKATVKLGFAEIIEADFISMLCGTIEEITPSGGRDKGVVTLSISDFFSVLKTKIVRGQWFIQHPLKIMYAGDGTTGILERCGFIGPEFVDEASFDPDGGLYPDIQHWVMTRFGDFDEYAGNNALDLLGALCKLIVGQIICNEAGIISFKRFDATAAASFNWTEDDIVPGSLEQDTLGGNVVNQVNIKFAKGNEYRDAPELQITSNDAASQTEFACPGQSTRVMEYTIETDWCPPYMMELITIPFFAADTEASIGGLWEAWETFTICGTRGLAPTAAAQPAGNKLSASKPAYLMIEWMGAVGGVRDILKCTTPPSVEPPPGTTYTLGCVSTDASTDPGTGVVNSYPYWSHLRLTGLVHGQYGSTARNYNDAMRGAAEILVFDVTIVLYCAYTTLARFRQGCPSFTIKTPLSAFDAQQGDIGTLTTPDYLAKGFDGLTSASKWEATSKEVDILSGEITWKFSYAGVGSLTLNITDAGAHQMHDLLSANQNIKQGFTSQPYVTSGLVTTQTSGLVGSVSAGTISAGYALVTTQAAQSHTFEASKDTYVVANAMTGGLAFLVVANGAAAPVIGGGAMFLNKVVTDATTITGITDIRETKPFLGSKLKEGTGPLTNLSSAGVLNSLASVTTKNLDQVDDGATYLRVAGVSAGHQAQTSSIAALAVTAPKVADNAVANVHVASGDPRVSANPNPGFVQYTRT